MDDKLPEGCNILGCLEQDEEGNGVVSLPVTFFDFDVEFRARLIADWVEILQKEHQELLALSREEEEDFTIKEDLH